MRILNDKQLPHEILLSLLDEMQNTIKDEHTKIERMEIWNKGKRNRLSCFNIYIAVFPPLSGTVKEGRW